MTTQEIKKILNTARTAEQEYSLAKEKMQSYRELLQGGKSIDYSDKPKSESKENSVENSLVLLADYETECRLCLARLVSVRKKISRYIEPLPFPEKEVMTRRYICCQRWEFIAEKMNYNLRHVYKIHGSALQKMALNGTIIL